MFLDNGSNFSEDDAMAKKLSSTLKKKKKPKPQAKKRKKEMDNGSEQIKKKRGRAPKKTQAELEAKIKNEVRMGS